MKILAIDTSQHALSVAVASQDTRVFAKHIVMPRRQSQEILDFVDTLLVDAGLSLHKLDAIAVGQGPGSFTGLRLAASVAQGLAFSANLPVVPVSSLQCMAQSLYERHGHSHIMVAIDARLNEIYWGCYQASKELMMPVGNEAVIAPSRVEIPFTAAWFGAGDGFLVYEKNLPVPPLGAETACIPVAVSLLPLARYYLNAGYWVKASDVSPVYLRDQVVIDGTS